MTHGPDQHGPETARIALSISTRSNGRADELPTYRGAQVAMEHLAARTDPAFRFELDMFDDFGDTQQTADMAARVVADERYVGVVGPMGSTEGLVNAPIFDAAGLLQVSPCASHPDLCRRGYRTFFRLVPNEETQGTELARIATRYLHASKVAIVFDDDAFGTTVTDNVSRGLERYGAQVVGRESFSRGAASFDALADAVLDSQPDLVFFAVHATEGGLASTELRDRGLRVPFLGTDGLKTSFFLGGGDDRGAAYHTHSGADFRRLASAAEFRSDYVARYPEDSTYSPEAYDAVMLVAQATERAGSTDRDKVLRAFLDLDGSPGITGRLSFDGTGERVDSPVSLYTVEQTADGRTMRYLGTTQELCPPE